MNGYQITLHYSNKRIVKYDRTQRYIKMNIVLGARLLILQHFYMGALKNNNL